MKSVNGDKLKKDVVFQYEGEEVGKPKFGTKFKYIGYETGGFEGQVNRNELYKDVYWTAEHSYCFCRHFWILKDELKPEKK